MQSSKRGGATFFASRGDFDNPEDAMIAGNIRQKVEWSKTSRGGRQYDVMKCLLETPVCSSSYGLCE